MRNLKKMTSLIRRKSAFYIWRNARILKTTYSVEKDTKTTANQGRINQRKRGKVQWRKNIVDK